GLHSYREQKQGTGRTELEKIGRRAYVGKSCREEAKGLQSFRE
ncbi:hypothetical protein A2U01_0021287, partial [Trifolium medium]|nr:hypothetical protein [Trifolium medium]